MTSFVYWFCCYLELEKQTLFPAQVPMYCSVSGFLKQQLEFLCKLDTFWWDLPKWSVPNAEARLGKCLCCKVSGFGCGSRGFWGWRWCPGLMFPLPLPAGHVSGANTRDGDGNKVSVKGVKPRPGQWQQQKSNPGQGHDSSKNLSRAALLFWDFPAWARNRLW